MGKQEKRETEVPLTEAETADTAKGGVQAKNTQQQRRGTNKNVQEVTQIFDRPVENWSLGGND